jgi:two-component system KDP operon response regulator KdpE
MADDSELQSFQTCQGELKLDFAAHRVWLCDIEVNLTKTEFKILELLCSNPGNVFEYDYLLKQVWGEEYLGSRQYLHQYIKTLRRKTTFLKYNPSFIINVAGVGYRLDVMY